MKILTLVVSLATALYSAQNLKKGDLIKLKAPVPVTQSKTVVMNSAQGTSATHLDDGLIFKVVKNENNQTQLKVYRTIKARKDEEKANLYNNKIYTVADTDLTDNYIITGEQERLSIGIITLPFKYRPQRPESFETEFNINTTLNIHWFRVGRGGFNIQAGTGFGSVRLDSSNSSLQNGTNVNAILLGAMAGAMIQYKNVQFGVYTGVDIINNNSQLQWVHNGKAWFGVGIGYSIFKLDISGKTE